MFQLGIFGTGNMAEALIAGITQKKVLRPNQIIGFDTNKTRLQFIQKKYKIKSARSPQEVCGQAQVILLAVKPQQIKELAFQIKPRLKKNQLLLSIAAGIDTKLLEKYLGIHPIIRLMPNTPAFIGLGATVYYANRLSSSKNRLFVKKLFEAVGLVVEIKQENLLDAVTALSGSGPAFVYSFIEALARGGKQCGLSQEMSLKLAAQTVVGASILLQNSSLSPQELIAKVTSKGGTTLAGLKVLQQKKFSSIVEKCLKAAAKRANELRKLI